MEHAADLLDRAVDAYLANNYVVASAFIAEAGLPEIYEYIARITGPIDPAIHWQKSMPKDVLPSHERSTLRMPTAKDEVAIFKRDGWCCRYCGCRVVSKKARSVLIRLFPKEARWGRRNIEKHSGLAALTASLDHVVPHSRGGTNAFSNLVTACGPCQFGRNDWTLEEVGFNDPRDRPPVVDGWDGLTRIL